MGERAGDTQYLKGTTRRKAAAGVHTAFVCFNLVAHWMPPV
jgi:hypothetical protein